MNRYLFNIALIKYGNITPCRNYKFFDERSFTVYKGKMYFWFNTVDGNTHIVKVAIDE